MCKNRKYWERKNNVGSWREKFWRASLHGNTLCAGWGKYGHFRTLFWTSYANVHREMEGCTWEIFVIFRYENHQFHFLLKKKKKKRSQHCIDLKTKGKLKREVDLCDILQRGTHMKLVDQKQGWICLMLTKDH